MDFEVPMRALKPKNKLIVIPKSSVCKFVHVVTCIF